MSKKPTIMNQNETAQYISERLKPMDPSTLSKLTNYGSGPDHKKKGNQKLFFRADVDEWIEKEKARRAAS